jgi:hypothetical protein
MKKQKKENKYIQYFLEFCCAQDSEVPSFEPTKEAKHKTSDYYIPELKTAIEVKEIHDTEANNNLAQWSKIIGKMRKYVDKHVEYKNIEGLYSVNTPTVFKFPTEKPHYQKAADDLIKAIKEEKSEVNIRDIKFEIKKISDKEKGIYFGAMGGGGFINPAGTIYQNIFNKIIIANQQLFASKNKKIKKRILLLTNRYHFANRIDEVIRGLSYGYNDLIACKHIDEIWIQLLLENNRHEHILIYDKTFFEKYENNSPEFTQKYTDLYQLWYYALAERGDEHKEKLFLWMKVFLQEKAPYEIFSDKFKRQEMVRLSEWLTQQERFEDAKWIINKFINDPDPAEPDSYYGDPTFNYHEKIMAGEDPSIITTVIGHLAWAVQKLCLQQVNIENAFNFTKQLFSHNNLYVKLEAMVPLVEITRRRQWVSGYGKRPREDKYAEFHNLVFDLISLVEQNNNYKAIAKRLVLVFSYYKDLSTEEALRVLQALKGAYNASGLFIYFGIYRSRHYIDQPINFNNSRLNTELQKIIEDHSNSTQDLRGGISWNFWKILSENENEFSTLKPYVDLFVKHPYDKQVFSNINRIISDWIDKETDVCFVWFKNLLDNAIHYVEKDAGSMNHQNLWLSESNKIVNVIANKYPEELIETIRKLAALWNQGAFIGDIKTLFESFKIISDDSIKELAKREFLSIYRKMKKVNPKLKEVEWQ